MQTCNTPVVKTRPGRKLDEEVKNLLSIESSDYLKLRHHPTHLVCQLTITK